MTEVLDSMDKEKEPLRERIPTLEEMGERIEERVEAAQEKLHDLIEDVKPKLRGWLHLFTVPVVLIAGLTLTVIAPTTMGRLGAAVYTFAAVLLFGVSAVYHRGNGWWDRRTHMLLKRLDHSNIFVLIAGSTTPFALTLLEGPPRWLLLGLMWGGTALGVGLKVFRESLPRWLSTGFYVVLGWLPVAFIGEFAAGASRLGINGGLDLALIAAGGLLYTVGAVIYGFKAFNTWPGVWTFHEWFHLCTILAFACHFVAIALVSTVTPI